MTHAHPAQRAGPLAISAAAVALSLIALFVTASGSDSDHAWLEGVARALTVGMPMAVGLFAMERTPFRRFGQLLTAAGAMWFLTTLANAGDPVAYSIGRVAAWIGEPLLVYLLLSFPTGRLTSRADRVIASLIALLVLVLYLPTALLVDSYPVPVPWTSCVASCPGNAFMVVGSEPGVVEDVIRPLRELLTVGLFAAVAVRLAQRLHSSTPLGRRALAPVLAVAWLHVAAFSGILLARRIAPDAGVHEVSVWVLTLTVPLAALAFLVGLVRWWVYIATATQRLAARLRGHPEPDDLRAALAEAFDDRSLDVVYWIGDGNGHWADAQGLPVVSPEAADGRAVTEVRDGERRVAAIIHDAALEDDRAFIDTATSYSLMTLDNHRLSAQTSSLLRAVRESRSRIQSAADDERRRIERDLHDGAQQRLVALRIKLELAAERTDRGDADGDAGAAMLRGLGEEVEQALEEVRSLARGIYPAPLADHGLVGGLRAAALRSPLPTTVLAAGVGRHPREIESAAYFCCLEALQNVAKHAAGATAAVIELRDDGVLRLEVRDDGAGFDQRDVEAGSGITNMRDRLAAVGGELILRSEPGRGTIVTGTIPLP